MVLLEVYIPMKAGQGSSPMAHASSKTEKSIEQGIVSILEPFIDTIVVCSVTGSCNPFKWCMDRKI